MRAIALAFWILVSAATAAAETEPIRDRYGRTVAYLRTGPTGRITVSDCYGTTLGSATDSGTFDRFGSRILDRSAPGILIPRSRCYAKTEPILR